MSRYDSFAPFYDNVVGDREGVARLLRQLIRRYNPKARDVLELGCGSGAMLQILTKHFRAVGVDNSKAMLSIARRKAPRAKLLILLIILHIFQDGRVCLPTRIDT
jgi:ubiquinone/menaquinone biosynthesis C-methylase UbiE